MSRFFIQKQSLIEHITKNKKKKKIFKSIELFESDIDILLCKDWFTDTILDYYFNILEEHAKLYGITVTSIVTHVSVKVGIEPKERTKERFHKMSLSGDDIILFPLFVNNNHFALIVVDNKHRRIEYLDSLTGNPNITLLRVFTQVVEEDYETRNGETKQYDVTFPKCPRQAGGYECGMYVCVFARNKIFGSDPIINAEDPDSHRLIIAHEILENKILYAPNHKFN